MERSLIDAAKRGEPQAQFEVGKRWHLGHGVPVDMKKAAHWWRKAAKQGHAEAQGCLGECYCEGEGVARDLDGDGEQSLWELDRVCAVTVNGLPLELNRMYTVVVSDFLLGGGDHQATGLGQGQSPQQGPLVVDAIRDHIQEAGVACRALDPESRVVMTDCDPTR